LTPKNDETATSGTLPPAELNPLLNPTLNKHLGRWAEVYFTNPAEKRDQAVVNLLRELERETTTADGASRRLVPKKIDKRRSVATPNAVICRDCGFENEAPQKFCGECGALLEAPVKRSASVAAKSARSRENETDSPRGEAVESTVPQFGSIFHLSDPALPQITGADLAEYADSTPLKRSYRFYIATGLALIIGALVYVAWRGEQSTSERAGLSAPSPPAATQSAGAPAPAATSPASAATSAAPPSESSSAPTPAPAETKAPSNAEAERTSKPVRGPEPAANSGTPRDLSGNGGQELALAQNLLNGPAKERDSATAAQWLWKAVEKQNTAATVLLAGLYLRGDGVPKNCDQGRVLLDAAATKGNKEAGTLLRNLKAFGCE
jgi:hypothetical protein